MYNHNKIEKKWREYWKKNKTNKFVDDEQKKKYYILHMFPYPSGSSLHMGHGRSYVITDFIARYKVLRGYNVFNPTGWDAFGLPSEQYAIKNNKNPSDFNQKNISIFREQLKLLAIYCDYDYEVDTADHNYYHWTQWIFAKLFENNLAEHKEIEVNWCEGLGTVLANDEIVIKDGKMYSERGEFPVIKKPMKQWVLKITDYAKELDEGLNSLDWDDSFKIPQKKWIGISTGAIINFKTANGKIVKVFTTRPDTIFGTSFVAIAPENSVVGEIVNEQHKNEVEKYVENAKKKTELERKENKEKTGVFIGNYAINPFTNKKIPIYICEYVLNDYATGTIMGVPAHDQRDYEFAKKYGLEMIKIIESDIENEAYVGDGKHINSDFINGLNKKEAIDKIISVIEERKIGVKHTTTKLHDWTFSRQRYWGEPFPIIYDENKNPKLVPYKDLPVILPELDNYQPDKTGKSPLERAKKWIEVEIDGKKYIREADTMPGSAGSSWYFLAFILKNPDGTYVPIDSDEAKKRFKRWMPMDLYIGGTEHATGHVLYARFWHRFLYNIGVIDTPEPFTKIIDHGLILGPDSQKMSKRFGNVVTPNENAESHGIDAVRVYALFIGPISGTFPWNTNGLNGIRKWLDRVFNLITTKKIVENISDLSHELNTAFHVFIKSATQNMEELKPNIVISNMMVYINACYEYDVLYKPHIKSFLIVFSCFAPHLAEELNEFLGYKTTIVKEKWPEYDEKLTQTKKVNLAIQENGKLRVVIQVDFDCDEKEAIGIALQNQKIKNIVENKAYKTIFVKNKIINFIIK